MTNAEGGSALAEEVMRSIAAEYNWPDYHPVLRASVPVDPKILADYVGTYELAPNYNLVFAVEGGHLTLQAAGQDKLQLYASSNTRFFPMEMSAEIEFVRDDQGKVTRMILHQNGQDVPAQKK
jgi:hypothetical protein